MIPALSLAKTMRDILSRIEESRHFCPDDPDVVELKRILRLKVSALEAQASVEEPDAFAAYIFQ